MVSVSFVAVRAEVRLTLSLDLMEGWGLRRISSLSAGDAMNSWTTVQREKPCWGLLRSI